MRITQGTFSYLPDSRKNRSRRRCDIASTTAGLFSIEHTDDPHPRNSYWEMWGLPMFDLQDLHSCHGATR